VSDDEKQVGAARPPIAGKAEISGAARQLLRSRRSATMATALASDGGRPYASLITVACDVDGSPILLLSDLSDHSRNLAADPRASLLFEDAGRRANPQTGPRLTLLGRIAVDDEPRLRRRFLARHPGAVLYAVFADFHVYRLSVDRAYWVGGFGQARWLETAAVLTGGAVAAAIAEAEGTILEELQARQPDAADRLALGLLGRKGTGWRIAALDPDGCDLARGEIAFARVAFSRPASDAAELSGMLRDLIARDSADVNRRGALQP